MGSKTINVTGFLDSHSLPGFQEFIVVMCFLIAVIDGFDTAAIGLIAPAISARCTDSWTRFARIIGPIGASSNRFSGGDQHQPRD